MDMYIYEKVGEFRRQSRFGVKSMQTDIALDMLRLLYKLRWLQAYYLMY